MIPSPAPVWPRLSLLLRQQQIEDRRCMRKPLRGDHQILTPDTHTLSGVRLCEQVLPGGGALGGVASGGTLRRRLRFEDETEVEAESRYLERERRLAGLRRGGILATRPDPRLYMGSVFQPRPPAKATTDRGRGVALHRLSLRTEPIRETYIGRVTPGGGAGRVREAGLISHVTAELTPTTDLPTNPYSPPPAAVASHDNRPRPEAGTASSERRAPPRPGSDPVREPISSDEASLPTAVEEPARLSLSQLFSTVRLSRTRTGSLDRTSPRTHLVPAASRKPSSPLKKSLSVQSLCAGDVGRPSSLRPIGRVLQVCSDGSVLLELDRPTGTTTGLRITRRGRRDSGVYVDHMVDQVQKLYSGLLSVGDKILEVNGEKVACLSLDQVNHLLVQRPRTIVRVLRHPRPSPQ